MDHICIWNVWSRDQEKARVLNYHNAAVKDVQWSLQGLFLLSCGYDCSSRLIDVETGLETQVFKEDQVVGVIKFHPNNSNLIRVGKVVNEYFRGLGPILDIEFTIDAKQFISSSDVSKGNIYMEAYTCPCIRSHQRDSYFVAQSNGNYIAIFSSRPPFKLNKYKRSTDLIKKIKAYEQACIDVGFHPTMSNVVASCSWSGDVSVFE
ncbi:transducin/WD40 repeat-like superfamily protein [Actinidia rufa]|uniref:Transducin/WD40 repeat-like superfamily protein n=1 Tax=Actinidia rufa TaxID=165716 RepID=A0A7J0G9J1_9ERIC|nr:transducin/WD40 repeat-like superfamily protein [Actinidia rufa]